MSHHDHSLLGESPCCCICKDAPCTAITVAMMREHRISELLQLHGEYQEEIAFAARNGYRRMGDS